MARFGITLDQVDSAMRQLEERGEHVTVDAVRAVLGTGSKSTIGPYIKQLRASRTDTVAPANTGLPKSVTQAVAALYTVMREEAGSVVQKMRADVEARESEALCAIDDAVRERNAAQSSLQAVQQAFSASQARNDELVQAVSQKDLELAHLRAQVAALVQRVEDRDKQITKVHEQLALNAIQYQHLEEESAVRLTAERRTADERVNAASRERQAAEVELAAAKTSLAAVRESLQSLRGEHEMAEEARQAAIMEKVKAVSLAEQISSSLEKLTIEKDAMASQLSAVVRDATERAMELSALQAEDRITQRELDRLRTIQEKLTRENASLKMEKIELESMIRSKK